MAFNCPHRRISTVTWWIASRDDLRTPAAPSLVSAHPPILYMMIRLIYLNKGISLFNAGVLWGA